MKTVKMTCGALGHAGRSWNKGPVVLGLICTVSWLSTAAAQNTASDITPDTLAPPLQRLNGSVVFSGQAGTQAPAGSEQIGITLGGVDLQDGLPELAAQNDAFVARLTRGRIPVSELFEATSELEASYAKAGLVLTRVILPQQSLREGGRLKVLVLNGFIETVDTSNVPESARARIEGLTAPLKDKPGLTRAELERQLLLAGDAPGTALRSALAAGDKLGSAVIALETEFRPITGFVGVDNFTSSDLGGFNLNSGVEFNSPFKFGETLYLRLSGSPKGFFSSEPQSRIFAAGAVVPLGFSGLTLNVEATSSDTTPDTPATPTRSSFDRQSIRLIYPFKRSRQINLTGQVSLDRQVDSQDLLGGGAPVPVFRDEIVALRFGGNLSYVHEDDAVTNAGLNFTQGIDGLGARTAEDAIASGLPLSRGGADASFSKLVGSVSHRRSLSDNLALSVSGRFQSSFGDPLVTAEQFSIVGAQEISAFDSGALRGDSGWVVRSEISTQVRTAIAEQPILISPYVFLGFGEVTLENPSAVEQGKTRATSYGVGVDLFTQFDSSFRSSSVRVELGRGERNDGVDDETRFSISGNLRF